MRTAQHGVMLFIAFLVSSSSPASGQSCIGDCDGNRAVAVNELIRCVTIVLGSAELETCPVCDGDGDGDVTINDLIAAVAAALGDCAPSIDSVTLSGTCKRPGAAGLVDCAAGTIVAASRCDERATCLEDASGRTELGEGAVEAAGKFSIVAQPSPSGIAQAVGFDNRKT